MAGQAIDRSDPRPCALMTVTVTGLAETLVVQTDRRQDQRSHLSIAVRAGDLANRPMDP